MKDANTQYAGLPRIVRTLAIAYATLALLNTLLFVLKATNPVIRSDAWYFMEVFIKKYFDGTLGIADFFVKRQGPDHAQPLFKLALWIELRWIHLDFTFEALLGVLGAIICTCIFLRFLRRESTDPVSKIIQYVAWATICALVFSLNSREVWTWPLVAIEFLTYIPMLLFMWAMWRAIRERSYTLLGVATLFLAIADDDSALIAILATSMSVALLALTDQQARPNINIKLIAAVVIPCVMARTWYQFTPVIGGQPSPPISTVIHSLMHGSSAQFIWTIITVPLKLSIVYDDTFPGVSGPMGRGNILLTGLACGLVVLHILFWWRAFRGNYNLAMFAAVSLMLLVYGWIAGIVLYRVAHFGESYLHSGRYVRFYAFGLVALILMWAGATGDAPPRTGTQGRRSVWFPMAACFFLVVLQAPISVAAWRAKPSLHAYYRDMAGRIERLAVDPNDADACPPELPVCDWPPGKRQELVGILASHQLNVFSDQVLAWHPYLVRPAPLISKPTASSPLEAGRLSPSDAR